MKWASNFLFEGVSAQDLLAIEPHVEPVAYSPDEVIMREGEPGDFMVMIDDGTVDVFKNEIKLSERGSEDLIGLMALVEGCSRSATVISGAKGTSGYKIDRDAWRQIMTTRIRPALLHNYLIYQQNTIRRSDAKRLKEVREKLRVEQKRVLSARFFVQMVIGLILFTFALGSLNELAADQESTYISFGVLFVYAAWSFVFLRQSKLPKAVFGLTMENFKPALRLSLISSFVFLVGMGIFRFVQTSVAPEVYGAEFFSFYENDSGMPTWGLIVLYSMHAIMQEFIARGCIQGGLHQFVSGKWASFTSIFLATMMFSVFHLMLDMKFALLTIIPSLLWGFIFYKQRNLLAVAISHIIIGVVAFFVLGIV